MLDHTGRLVPLFFDKLRFFISNEDIENYVQDFLRSYDNKQIYEVYETIGWFHHYSSVGQL